MTDVLRSNLTLINADWVMLIFTILMALAFIIGIYLHRKNRQPDFLEFLPSLLTSLGILGTFTGIILGLLDFDLKQIDESLSALLNGLKTAFLTSILGIALSILFKVLRYLIPAQPMIERPIEIDDLHAVMLNQIGAIKGLSEIVDRNQTLQIERLDDFMRNFAYESSKSIVQELKTVVTEFNTLITDQFGENFKEFGAAFAQFEAVVNSTKDSFAEHETRMKVWSATCNQNIESLSQVSSDVSGLRNHLSDIPEFLGSIQPMMDAGIAQMTLLNKQMEEYESITSLMASMVPTINDKVEKFTQGIDDTRQMLTGDLAELVNQYQKTLQQAQDKALEPIDHWQKHLDEAQNKQQTLMTEWRLVMEKSVSELSEQYRVSMDSMQHQGVALGKQVQNINSILEGLTTIDKDMVSRAIEHTLMSHRDSMQDLAAHQSKTHREMSEYLANVIVESLGKTEVSVGKHLSSIEHHMEREIEQVMRAMGDALGAISGQFTRDYQLLIRQMKRVIDSSQVSAE